LLIGVSAAAVVFAGLAAAAAFSALDAREKERVASDALAGRQAALELAQTREDALSVALEESEALRETASESARAAIAAQLAERAERERADAAQQAELTQRDRADANRAEADRATVALTAAEALNQQIYFALSQLDTEGAPELEATRRGQAYALGQAAMAEAPSVESRQRAVQYFREALHGASPSHLGVAPHLALGEAYLQLAGLMGPAGSIDFECAPGGGDPSLLSEALYYLQFASSRSSGPSPYRLQGCALQALGRFNEGILSYQLALNLAPDDAVTRLYLSRATAERALREGSAQ
jgi:hypothetical protein